MRIRRFVAMLLATVMLFSMNPSALMEEESGPEEYIPEVAFTLGEDEAHLASDSESEVSFESGDNPITPEENFPAGTGSEVIDLGSVEEELNEYTSEEVAMANAIIDWAIDESNFPDANFCTYVQEYCDTDRNGSLSDVEINAVTEIDCSFKEIASLKGIELFSALKKLRCTGNSLEELNVSKNIELTALYCDSNYLVSLDVSNNIKLTYLSCRSNKLTILNVSKNIALENLFCSDNKLTKLETGQNKALKYLDCGRNKITSLDVSQNSKLIGLSCGGAYLKWEDGTTTWSNWGGQGNLLTQLDVSHNSLLNYLYCDGNKLTSLNVAHNRQLTILYCHNNQLKALDVGDKPWLLELLCHKNQLTSLDIHTCTKLVKCYHQGSLVSKDGVQQYELRDGKYILGTFYLDQNVTVNDGGSALPVQEPEGLSIQASKPNPIGIKDTVQLTVKAPSDVSLTKLKWKSSNSNIATVSSKGIVTGTSAGSATITVTNVDKLSASINITVKDQSAPTSVSLSPKETKLGLKEKVQLTANMTAEGKPVSKLTWMSDNKKVATVDSKGKVTGKGFGTAKITVKTANGLSDTATIIVKDVNTPTSISLSPKETKLGLKEKVQLTANMTAEGKPVSKLTWMSDNKKVATVDSKGKVTGKGFGTAKITVKTANGLSDTATIIVKDVNTPTSISLSPKEKTLGLKETVQLEAVMTAEGTPKSKLTWKSNNTKVATVTNKGKVTGKAYGKATITVTTANGLSANIDVVVKDTSTPTSITLSPDSVNPLNVKDTIQLTATMTAEGTPKSKLTWSSSNPNVVTVDTKGLVKAKGYGNAIVTVTTRNGLSAYIDITVLNPNKIEVAGNTSFENEFLGRSNHESWLLRYHSIDLSRIIYSMDTDAKDITNAMAKLGFDSCYSHYGVINDEFLDNKEHKIGYIFAYNDILTIDGASCRVFAIICRGTNDNSEWASNFTIGTGSRHYGFDLAARSVFESFKQYWKEYSVGESDKIWITGHSRGAAVANLLAGYYIPQMSISDSQIYCYTFACPLVDRNAVKKDNIFNYNFGGDIVPRVPFKQWKYKRFGKTVTLKNGDNIAGINVLNNKAAERLSSHLGSLSSKEANVFLESIKDDVFSEEGEISWTVVSSMIAHKSIRGLKVYDVLEVLDIAQAIKLMGNTHPAETYFEWIKELGDSDTGIDGHGGGGRPF